MKSLSTVEEAVAKFNVGDLVRCARTGDLFHVEKIWVDELDSPERVSGTYHGFFPSRDLYYGGK